MIRFQHYYLIFKDWLSSIRTTSTSEMVASPVIWNMHCICPYHTCSFLFGPCLFLVSILFVHSCRYCYSDLAQASFIFIIFLPTPTQCWDYMCTPLNLIIVALMITMFSYVRYLNSPFSEIIYSYLTTWKNPCPCLNLRLIYLFFSKFVFWNIFLWSI